MSEQGFWYQSDLKCRPLDSIKDINNFLFDPPVWRSLCQPLRPHSKRIIRNSELTPNFLDITLEAPASFCHYEPDEPSVIRYDEWTLPKTLVCHDMANGYHDDSAIDGTSDYTAYTFYNWAAVDIFCYFSHHLVTIPPLGWINVAHAHGVKVIGTLITEWADGVSFWKKVLASEVAMQNVVSALVTIAKTLKFEGWLLNVENKIVEPEKLLDFVKMLHSTLHAEVPDAVLIWYDSVTITGDLHWQNKLNQNNSAFFDACDGLFTNYSWSREDIMDTVAAAASRKHDVFVGVDVWGRNFFGGGMFNTQEALKIIYDYGLSIAIFAPAWTHEAMDTTESNQDNSIAMGDELPIAKRFLLRDRAFWGSIWPYLNTRLPCELPFKTSFCRGLGKKRRMYGEVLCNSSWYNLRHMQYQPNSMHGPHCFLLSTIDKINKVSSYKVKDVQGIMRMRQSLVVLCKKMYEESKIIIKHQDEMEKKEESDADLDSTREGSNCIQEGSNSIQEGSDSVQEGSNSVREGPYSHDSLTDFSHHTKENRLKSVFKHMFKFKKTKISIKENSEHGHHNLHEGQHEAGASSSEQVVGEGGGNPRQSTSSSQGEVYTSSGRSMVEMPVQLRLGTTPETRLALAFVPDERECLEVYFDDAFNGGTCLKINPSDQILQSYRTIRLFHCDFSIEDSLIVCLVTKPVAGFSSQYLRLKLHVTKGGEERVLVLVGRPTQLPGSEASPSETTNYPIPIGDQEFKDLQSYLVVNEPGFYVPIENSYGWQVMYFQLKISSHVIHTVGLRTGEVTGPLLLGHVALCARDRRTDVERHPIESSVGSLTFT